MSAPTGSDGGLRVTVHVPRSAVAAALALASRHGVTVSSGPVAGRRVDVQLGRLRVGVVFE